MLFYSSLKELNALMAKVASNWWVDFHWYLILWAMLSHIVLWFNSSRPDDIIWHHGFWQALVQVMACCLTAPSHNLNQSWCICIVNLALRKIFQWDFIQNSNIFIQENAFQNVVCNMAAILFRLHCVNVTPLQPVISCKTGDIANPLHVSSLVMTITIEVNFIHFYLVNISDWNNWPVLWVQKLPKTYHFI